MAKFLKMTTGRTRHLGASLAAAVISVATLAGCQEAPPSSAVGPGRASIGSTKLPCDVQDSLEVGCQGCHGAVPIAGAPMALMTWEDLTAPSVTNPTMTVAQVMNLRINSTDPALQMPPANAVNASTLFVKQTLNGWMQGGTPAGTMDCGGGTGGTGGVAGSFGGTGGTGGVAGNVGGTGGTGGVAGNVGGTGGTGGVGQEQCYQFQVHAQSNPADKSPFAVQGQFYSCFHYDMPWAADAQAVRIHALPDPNGSIVHHWLVYTDDNGNQPDGTVIGNCSGTHPSSPTLVAGWALGAQEWELPADVGLKIGTANRKMLIEYHWYNQGPTVQSTHTIEICTAGTPRPNSATVSWLGSEQIFLGPNSMGTVTGNCNAQASAGVPYNGDIHIIRSWPHMHKYGYKMESWIVRAGTNARELLLSEMFSFDRQMSYDTPAVLHPGDRVETTCFYNTAGAPGLVTIGYFSDEEMCFNFVTAYPAGALKNFGLGASSTLTSSATGCLF